MVVQHTDSACQQEYEERSTQREMTSDQMKKKVVQKWVWFGSTSQERALAAYVQNMSLKYNKVKKCI